MRFHHLFANVIAVAVAAGLSACGSTAPMSSAAACTELVAPSTVEALAARGAELDSSWPSAASSESHAELFAPLIEAGGLSCRWGSGDDAAIYSYAELSPTALTEAEAALEQLGFTAVPAGDETDFIAPDGAAVLFITTSTALLGVAGTAELTQLLPYTGRFD